MSAHDMPAAGETDPGHPVPSLTMADLLRFADMAVEFPPEDRILTLQQVMDTCSEDEAVWLLQEWIRGRLEAYDARSHMPVLAPRPHRPLRMTWDFISGVLPDVGMGHSVRIEKVPSRLALYGELRIWPDGIWSFALHPHDQPPLKRIMLDRPLSFPVSLVLKNEHTGAEDRTCLFLHLHRDARAGLVAWADYGPLRFHGFSRAIRDLAENCARGKAFSRDHLTAVDTVLWINVVAWFFSVAFTRELPGSLRRMIEEGTPENQTAHQARSQVVWRLGAMVFDRMKAEETLRLFREKRPALYPYDGLQVVEAVPEIRKRPQPAKEADGPPVPVPPREPEALGESGKQAVAPDLYALMASKLPELLPRSRLPDICKELLGTSLIGKSTLEKLDARKEGPPNHDIGGRVHYRREEFIEWYRAWRA